MEGLAGIHVYVTWTKDRARLLLAFTPAGSLQFLPGAAIACNCWASVSGTYGKCANRDSTARIYHQAARLTVSLCTAPPHASQVSLITQEGTIRKTKSSHAPGRKRSAPPSRGSSGIPPSSPAQHKHNQTMWSPLLPLVNCSSSARGRRTQGLVSVILGAPTCEGGQTRARNTADHL